MVFRASALDPGSGTNDLPLSNQADDLGTLAVLVCLHLSFVLFRPCMPYICRPIDPQTTPGLIGKYASPMERLGFIGALTDHAAGGTPAHPSNIFKNNSQLIRPVIQRQVSHLILLEHVLYDKSVGAYAKVSFDDGSVIGKAIEGRVCKF